MATKEVDVPVDQPWARVRTPAQLPTPVGPDLLLGMDGEEFSELVRGHLMPRDDQPGGRKQWNHLWALLMGHDELTERTFDVLADFFDATQDALEGGELGDAEASRASKFKGRCDEAWKRLQHVEDEGPLAWAGKAADGFNPVARKVIAVLIAAIARHRTEVVRSGGRPTSADQALWDSMQSVQLDPRSYHYRERP